jgi:hypothetical protein
MTAVVELSAITYRGHHRCGDLRPYPLDSRDSLRRLAGAERTINASIERRDSLIEITQKIKELCYGFASRSGEPILCVFQNAGNLLARLTNVAGEGDASIPEKSANLARYTRAVIHQALAGTVQHLNILLFDRALRYEPHVWLLDRDADRLGIVAVILLVTPERLHILRTYDPQCVAVPLKLPRPEVCAVASLYPNHAGLDPSDHLDEPLALNPTPQADLPKFIDTMQLKHILCQIYTDCLDRHRAPRRLMRAQLQP